MKPRVTILPTLVPSLFLSLFLISTTTAYANSDCLDHNALPGVTPMIIQLELRSDALVRVAFNFENGGIAYRYFERNNRILLDAVKIAFENNKPISKICVNSSTGQLTGLVIDR